jgi:hypothetical protein
VNWLAVLGTMAAVMTVTLTTTGMIGMLAKAPIDAELARLAVLQDRIDLISVKRDEFKENTTRFDDRWTSMQADSKREIDRIYGEIRILQNDIVTRSEDSAHWSMTENSLKALTERMNALGEQPRVLKNP